jgi:geranylgeranyl diphosphate synthase type I
VEEGKVPDIKVALGRHRVEIEAALRNAIARAAEATPRAVISDSARATMYRQIEYHLGWLDENFEPAGFHPGKLIRPALALLTAELTGGRKAATNALPIAVTVELIHNFSLIHDDIEDHDETRRGRPTLWSLWGMEQAINSGDALFALARMQMWEFDQPEVAPSTVIRLARLVDRTALELCEGQYLDMLYEGRRDVTEAMYLDMIERKTAALMACAAEAGALIGAPANEELSSDLRAFGRALGLAFQLRDDVLGIWSAKELGKEATGDIRRKKMTLPLIYAFAHVSPDDHAALEAFYDTPGEMSNERIARTLEILDRCGARKRAYAAIHDHLDAASAALRAAREAASLAFRNDRDEAGGALASLVAFIRADALV